MMRSARHVFLSPHPDDVVWSCGGEIARLVSMDIAVAVVTVFDGDGLCASDWPRAAWASHHQEEIARAAELLGFEHHSIGLLDAANRFDALGFPLYPTAASLRGDINEDDDSLRTVLARRFDEFLQHGDTLYSPLGVATHVDHVLVSAAASLVRPLHFRFHEFRYHQSVTPAFEECGHDQLQAWIAAGLSFRREVRAVFGRSGRFEDAVLRFSGHADRSSFGG